MMRRFLTLILASVALLNAGAAAADRLKDMAGVMQSFAEHIIDGRNVDLALVGPSVAGVADDPEGLVATLGRALRPRRVEGP